MNFLSLRKDSHAQRIAVLVGTRPNFIKAAAFLREARNHPEFECTVIHTGQHFDEKMSDIFFQQMDIPEPDIFLRIEGVFHTEKIGRMFDQLKLVLKNYKFDGLVVFGDVNSTLAGALAAVKNNTPLFHVEAGLRSHDQRMPEEINRVIVDHLSARLFTSEPSAEANLRAEGVKSKKIVSAGNIMIETMETFWPHIQQSSVLRDLNLNSRQYVLATIHRQENTTDTQRLRHILTILNEINRDSLVIFPLHPGTQQKIAAQNLGDLLEPLRIIEPLGYFDFIHLIAESGGVISDSGGIQEETSHLGVACATLRDNTERPLTIEKGSNKLFPIATAAAQDIRAHLARTDFYQRHLPLWDSGVSGRIFSELKQFYSV